MAGATFPRLHVWADNEDVYASDLNAEFDNVLNNFSFSGLDDYSINVAQMRIQTTPGGVGTESLATSGAGEQARLRFVIARLTGQTYWYDAPALSISDINSLLNSGVAIPANRIASGRTAASDHQAMALVPNGASNSVSLQAATTNLVYYIAGVRYTATANSTLSGLTAAPSSNNTTLVNDSTLAGAVNTKLQGEYGSIITVDAMGSEITALVGKFAAFKIVHSAVTEYFIAFVNSSTQLTKAMRGCFFTSADAAIPRVAVSDNDVITLMKLTHIFVKTDGTLDFTYTSPTWATSAPSSPAVGDFWFDMTNLVWKKYNGTSFAASASTLLGVCIQDSTNTVAARTFEYFFVANALNSLQFELASTTLIRGNSLGQRISVMGTGLSYQTSVVSWANSGQFASGVSLTSSTTYYMYVTDVGEQIIDIVAPHDRTMDLLGYYHPSKPWRAVGYFDTDGSSLFTGTHSYGGVFQSQIAARPYRLDQNIGGVATSGNAGGSGTFSTASNGVPVAVTDCSLDLITKGGPVFITLKGYDTTEAMIASSSSSAPSTASSVFMIYRNGTAISKYHIDTTTRTDIPPGAVSTVDYPPAGKQTYALYAMVNNAISTALVTQCELVAWEIT